MKWINEAADSVRFQWLDAMGWRAFTHSSILCWTMGYYTNLTELGRA